MRPLEKVDNPGYKDLSLKIKDEIYQLSNGINQYELGLYEQESPNLKKLLFIRRLSVPIAIILAIITIFLIKGLGRDMNVLWFFIALMTGLATISTPILAYDETEKLIKLGERYNKYISEIGEDRIIAVDDLASVVALDKEEAINDLTYMIQNGYFKDARLAEDNQLLILDKQTFDMYKQTKLAILDDSTKDEVPEISVIDFKRAEADNIIKNCSSIIHDISSDSEYIENINFKANIDLLLSEVADILNYLNKYPSIYAKLNKFQTYYLPTAAKLVKSYRDFEEMNLDDSLLINSMNEIEESIIILIDGFKKLKLDMVSSQTMDLKAESKAMKMVLDLDGYAREDIK